MGLLEMPPELLLLLADHLELYRDILALCQVHDDLHDTLIGYLYRRNAKDHQSDALLWAAMYDRLDIIETALEHGADINTLAFINDVDAYALRGVLFSSSMRNRLRAEYERKIEEDPPYSGPSFFSLIHYKVSPLALASSAGHLELVLFLLENGALIERAEINDLTPLMYAAEGGHIMVVKALLRNGANFNAQWDGYEKAVDLAAAEGHDRVIDVLLSHGADVNGTFALVKAANRGDLELVQFLLNRGADITVTSPLGKTAFLAALEGGHLKVMVELLQRGQDIESRVLTGITPLLYSFHLGSLRAFKLLLELGADIDATDENGHTAMWWASTYAETELVDLLVARRLESESY